MAHVQSHTAHLQKVFTEDDMELAARVARVCVLFEDLRVEYHGARSDDLAALDQLSIQYRRFYFLRRSLVTLHEFSGAISRLNAVKSWNQRMKEHPSEEQREIWKDAIQFFSDWQDKFATIRNDVGGHYQEKAAKYAVESMSSGTVGTLDIVVENNGADTKLHFATELVARLLVKDIPEGTEKELKKYVTEIFEAVFDGWVHVIKAVHVVAIEYLVRRFIDNDVGSSRT